MTKKGSPARWLFIAAVVGVLVATVGSPAGGQARGLSSAPSDNGAPVATATPAAPRRGTPNSMPPLQGQEQLQLIAERAAVIAALKTPQSSPKLDTHLAALSEADRNLKNFGLRARPRDEKYLSDELRSELATGSIRVTDASMVQVFVSPEGVAVAEAAIRAAGGTVERADPASRLVQAQVPVDAVDALSADPSVRFVRPPDYGVVQAGSVTTEGDSILRANLARAAAGVSGAGIRIGVISNGVEGLAASQASADLPPVNTTTCNVTSGLPTDPGAGAEGTAMLEIVHDLAPGAELWYGYFKTGLEFNAAVNCLAQNVDVVVDDVGFFNAGPYDGSSYISANTTAALANPANRARVHVTAVGNDGLGHYLEPYVPCGATPLQQVSATANTIDLVALGTRCSIPVLARASSPLNLYLSWNDPYGASCNDYDLGVFVHDSSTLIASSITTQACAQNPTEAIHLFNNGPDTVVDIVISNYHGLAAPRTLNLFAANGPELYYLTPNWAISNEADAKGNVLSIAAIDAHTPPYNVTELYSSWGPTYDGRQKPELAAVDCVTVTGDGGFPVPFCGTSAAAPHVGAIAALLLQCQPSLLASAATDPAVDRATLRAELINSAVDLPPPGLDNLSGAGRIDALNAVTASCPSATPTPSATATPTNTPVPTATSTTQPTATNTPQPASTTTPTATRTPVPCAIRRADVDGDGVVSILDLALVAGDFLQTVPPAPARYDQDGDGVISILDLAQMAGVFLQPVSACP